MFTKNEYFKYIFTNKKQSPWSRSCCHYSWTVGRRYFEVGKINTENLRKIGWFTEILYRRENLAILYLQNNSQFKTWNCEAYERIYENVLILLMDIQRLLSKCDNEMCCHGVWLALPVSIVPPEILYNGCS